MLIYAYSHPYFVDVADSLLILGSYFSCTDMDFYDSQGIPTSTENSSTRKWVFNCKSSEERDTWARVFQFAIDNRRAIVYNSDRNVNDTVVPGEEHQDDEEGEEERSKPEYSIVKESMLLMKLRTGNDDDKGEYEACNFTAIQWTSQENMSIHYSKISKAILEPHETVGVKNPAMSGNHRAFDRQTIDSIHTEHRITSKEYKVCVDYEEPVSASAMSSSPPSPKRRKYGLVLLQREVSRNTRKDPKNSNVVSSPLLGMFLRFENEHEKTDWSRLINNVLGASNDDIKVAAMQVQRDNARQLVEMEKKEKYEASMQPVSGT